MQASVLLLGGAVAVLASAIGAPDDPSPRAAQTVEVSVRVDCLAGRGVSFSLTPWSITLQPGDSVNWKLDSQANVDSMEVLETKGKGWPFKRKPPYKSRRARAAGAQGLDPIQKAGKYKYSVQAICVRSTNPAVSDTVLIDPDMIIIRGSGA